MQRRGGALLHLDSHSYLCTPTLDSNSASRRRMDSMSCWAQTHSRNAHLTIKTKQRCSGRKPIHPKTRSGKSMKQNRAQRMKNKFINKTYPFTLTQTCRLYTCIYLKINQSDCFATTRKQGWMKKKDGWMIESVEGLTQP